eukprot:Transcript_4732.p2 GENE.Transcript_4732~~Transcript_4732.p2  ORF type:complete len:395 (-),score=117.26 Transcript_4732:172-1356(-)
MLNGMLQLGAGVEFIVEVQFHVRALFELKHDLHVLYAGARVLGAMDDVMVMHEGIVTDEVLERMERKVLRKLVLTFTKMSLEQRGRIEKMLQTEPCPLLELDMSFSSVTENATEAAKEEDDLQGFLDVRLEELLVPSSNKEGSIPEGSTAEGSNADGFVGDGGHTIACRRLRRLELSATGLIGTLPISLCQCRGLKKLTLGGNKIEGSLPVEWFDHLVNLEWLNLADNQLTGGIPSNIGTRCKKLQKLYLQGNKLTGELPESLNSCENLLHLMVFGQKGEKLSGELPKLILPKMQKFLAEGNNFRGEVPESLKECGSQNASKGQVTINLAGSQLHFPEKTRKLFRDDYAFTWVDKEGRELDDKSLVLSRAEDAFKPKPKLESLATKHNMFANSS